MFVQIGRGAVVVGAMVVSASFACAGTLTGLSLAPMGTLPNGTYSYGVAISGDGRVAVGTGGIDSTNRPLAWTLSSGCFEIATPADGRGTAHAVSSDGSAIAGRSYNTGMGFRWTQATGAVSLGPVSDPVLRMGISGDGNTIAARRSSGGSRWRAGLGWEDLAGMTDAPAITPDASVIVGIGPGPGGQTAVKRWTEATGAVTLPTPAGAANPYAIGVSADGDTVVGRMTVGGALRAFRWSEDSGMVNLGTIAGATFTGYTALGTNQDGSIIIGTATGGGSAAAFVWTPSTGMVRLRNWLGTMGLPIGGFTPIEANGITPDGMTITGFGGVDGLLSGFVVHIPGPGAGAMAVMMGGMLAGRRRRR